MCCILLHEAFQAQEGPKLRLGSYRSAIVFPEAKVVYLASRMNYSSFHRGVRKLQVWRMPGW